MTIFVDGYNLIFAASKRMSGFDIVETQAAREKLLDLLGRYKATRSDRITVFFDGGRDAAHLPRRMFDKGMEVVFSDADSDADSDIKNAVSHDDQPAAIRVVTSDVAIQKFICRYGAQAVESREFLDELTAALDEHAMPQDEPVEKYEGGADEDDMNYWLGVFGGGDEDDTA